MSKVVTAAVEALNARMENGGFNGSALFVIADEGAIIIDGTGAHAAGRGAVADVTLTADADTFQSILQGDLAATTAFMSGRLAIDGDMGRAMALGSLLS